MNGTTSVARGLPLFGSCMPVDLVGVLVVTISVPVTFRHVFQARHFPRQFGHRGSRQRHSGEQFTSVCTLKQGPPSP